MGCLRTTYNKNDTLLKVVHSKTPFFLLAGEDKKPYRTKKRLNAHKYKYNGKELQDEFGLDWYDYGARNSDPAVIPFTTIDPRAEEYYSQSPYVFASNNPVFYVDVNGEGVENDYKLDKKTGNISLIKKTNDKSDTLYATDENGNVDKNKSVTVGKEKPKDNTIISELAVNKTYNSGKSVNFATTKNIKDALNVFQFAAYNSNVEWGIYGSTKDGGTFALGTYQDENRSPVFSGTNFNLGFTNRNVKFDIHSHVGRFATPGPSGSIALGKGDIVQKRTKLRYRYIYYVGYGRNVPKGTLFRYGNNRKTAKLGRFKPNVRSLTERIKL